MMRVISSPSCCTTGLATLILAMRYLSGGQDCANGAREGRQARYSKGAASRQPPVRPTQRAFRGAFFGFLATVFPGFLATALRDVFAPRLSGFGGNVSTKSRARRIQ